MTDLKGPVLIDLSADAAKPHKVKQSHPSPGPDTAPPVPDDVPMVSGQAMQTVVALGARRPSRLLAWFWRLFVSLAVFGMSLWAWDFLTALVARNAYLGYGAIALTGAFLLVCLAMVLRELAAISRLGKVDRIRQAAEAALATDDLGRARSVSKRLKALYAGRKDMQWSGENLREREAEIFDAEGQLGLLETHLMAPLDQAAIREIEAAARQVATVTAIVPLALADVATALVANVRMIRRISEIYGARAGTFGSWRLTRSVLTHLVATGAVAIGDDLISSVAGGGLVSKLSRRFGEGIVNGALTARVGVAAMDVCRPLPFQNTKRPSVTGLVRRALTGLFGAK